MKYDLSITVELPFEKAVEAVRVALAEQGFGILTEIDVQTTMREKLDAGMEPCHPWRVQPAVGPSCAGD